MRIPITVLAAALLCCVGCKTATDGTPRRSALFNHVSGVPLRIKVPSHLQVQITETVMLQKEADGEEWKPLQFDRPVLNVDTGLRYTEEIVTVDFREKDRAIKDTSEALGGLMESVASMELTPVGPVIPAEITDVIYAKRTVGWSEFDIRQPGFEIEVQQFIERHLSNCVTTVPFPPFQRTPPSHELIPAPTEDSEEDVSMRFRPSEMR